MPITETVHRACSGPLSHPAYSMTESQWHLLRPCVPGNRVWTSINSYNFAFLIVVLSLLHLCNISRYCTQETHRQPDVTRLPSGNRVHIHNVDIHSLNDILGQYFKKSESKSIWNPKMNIVGKVWLTYMSLSSFPNNFETSVPNLQVQNAKDYKIQ